MHAKDSHQPPTSFLPCQRNFLTDNDGTLKAGEERFFANIVCFCAAGSPAALAPLVNCEVSISPSYIILYIYIYKLIRVPCTHPLHIL